MNPFTGGCHYTDGCERYQVGCGRCPQLGSTRTFDLSRRIWKRKQASYDSIRSGKLHLVPLNSWMAQLVQKSSLLGRFPVTIIPNGLDTEEFAPRDIRMAREALGLPQDAKVILFVADSVSRERKGLGLLSKALERLSRIPNLCLATVGGGAPLLDGPIRVCHLGRTDNDRLLSFIYSAADIFVIPSLEDNMPNTVLESLACGTPVVGFDTGGIPEMVRPGVTGTLVPVGDSVALEQARAALLQDDATREEMSRNCRRIAVEEYSLEGLGRNYRHLYERILGLVTK